MTSDNLAGSSGEFVKIKDILLLRGTFDDDIIQQFRESLTDVLIVHLQKEQSLESLDKEEMRKYGWCQCQEGGTPDDYGDTYR